MSRVWTGWQSRLAKDGEGATMVEYAVAAGDTLWEITTIECKKHPLLEDFIDDLLGIWVANIAEVGSDPNSIDVGQVLTLPCDPPP